MPSDVVRVICPNLTCRAILSVPALARGKTVRCRQCGARVRIPGGSGVPGGGSPHPGSVEPVADTEPDKPAVQ